MVNSVWYFISDIQRPDLCKVWMHGCVVYERWIHIQLARAIDEQQFCERETLYGLVWKGKGPLASWGGCPCSYPIVANVKYMQVGVGHYDLPLPVWLGVGLGPALRALG